MPATTFTYKIPTGNSYAWSSGSNWSTGSVPTDTTVGNPNLVIPGVSGDVSFDNLGSLTVGLLEIGSSSAAADMAIASGDTLETTGPGSLYGTLTVGDSGAKFLSSGFTNDGTIVLDSGATDYTTKLQTDSSTAVYDFAGAGAELWASTFNAGAFANADILFGNGGTIFLSPAGTSGPFSENYVAPTATNPGTLTIDYTLNGTPHTLFTFYDFNAGTSAPNLAVVAGTDPYTGASQTWIELTATCFTPGTLIETETGARPVEELRSGERVWAVAGASPRLSEIRWIGQRRIDLRRHPKPEGLYPVRIRKDALGEGLPARDLLVSPDHCLLIEGQLIPAKLLINGLSITHERSITAVHYFHIELDNHDAVLAEGVPAESYLDTGNRGFFGNTATPDLIPELPEPEAMIAWQDRLCAPLRLRTEEADGLWQRFHERAKAVGYCEPAREITDESDIRLMAGGREFRPVLRRDSHCTFVLPAASGEIRIMSRSAVPTDLDRSTNDWRRLGVAISKIVVRAGTKVLEFAADHQSLQDGWHPVEQGEDGMWRWTTGNAGLAIPAKLRTGSITVDLYLTGRASYFAAEATQAEVAA
jgi:Hint domain